jgi:iron complex transport system substrate-binding protein
VLLAAVFLLFPLAVTDAGDHPHPSYQRIVSLGPLITENIFLLGAGDALIGNTVYCQKPEAARYKAKVGSVQELSIEKIVSLQPDLILANNLTPFKQIEQLRQLGLHVETFRQPASFADICAQFLRLGRILGLEQRAAKIVAQAQKKVSAVQRAVSGIPRQKVFLQVGAHPLFSSVKNSFTNDFIELGGGKNIAGDQLMGAMRTEQVLALNPDVIIIALMGTEHGIGAAAKTHWLTFSTIRAVHNGRVHVINPDLVCSPSPTTFADTLVTIAHMIHPQAIISLTPSTSSRITFPILTATGTLLRLSSFSSEQNG